MTISVHKKLESETIHLPEAAPLVGKQVRITVEEEPIASPPRDFSTLEKLAGSIELDWDAIEELRRRSTL